MAVVCLLVCFAIACVVARRLWLRAACGADGGDDALAGAGDDGAGVKRLGCRYCEYRADKPSGIARHERTHTGEKPFGCRHCEYRAAQASSITEHERIHSGEKPYSCRVCDYRAAESANVRRHERRHHDL